MSVVLQKDLSTRVGVPHKAIQELYDIFLDKALKVEKCEESERVRFERAVTCLPSRAFEVIDASLLVEILWEIDRAFEKGREFGTQHKMKSTSVFPIKEKVRCKERSAERDFYIKKLRMFPEDEGRHYCATVEQLREWAIQEVGISQATFIENT